MTAYAASFRRTDQDRKPPRRVLTAYLLGDPPADLEERRRAAETRAASPDQRQSYRHYGARSRSE